MRIDSPFTLDLADFEAAVARVEAALQKNYHLVVQEVFRASY